MKQRLIQIWKDPVLSKVISAGIIGIIVIGYNYIFSKLNNETFLQTFKSFRDSKFELWKIILACAILIVIILIIRKLRKKPEIQVSSFDVISIKNLGYNPSNLTYTHENRSLDIVLFNMIRYELLSADDEIEWLRGQSFDHGFEQKYAFAFFDFREKIAENPNFEFFNSELEEIKRLLVFNVESFTRDLSTHTFPEGNSFQSVPREWREKHPDKYIASVEILQIGKSKVIETYDKFVRTGRKVFKI
ncbi:hypothetical protein [Chryseobacterium mulctrae]|uniref:hypothetical protein n=1 Tax=Chryseobacterium mulctrae TaxID=2576777 RepID=UPI0011173BB7|nr:hypothetical protein [Chryseobacterium mulctrae]